MSTDPIDDLKTAMQALRNSRAQAQVPSGAVPAGATAPPPPAGASTTPPPLSPPAKPAAARPMTGKKTAAPVKPPPIKPATGSAPAPPPDPPLTPEVLEDARGNESGISGINLADHFSEKEMLFIGIFLAGGCSRMEAMISAGYTEGNLDSNHYRARKIIAKYESLAGEHRKTFRAVGAGEVAVAQGLLALATAAKSEMVRLNAWTAIGKILGLTQDVVATNLGIQIVIKGREDHTGRPATQVRQEASRVPPRAVAITK